MKSIRVFIIFIAISLFVGLGIALNGHFFTQKDTVEEQKNYVEETEPNEENDLVTEKEPIVEEKEESSSKEEQKESEKKEPPKSQTNSTDTSSKPNNSSSASKPNKNDSTSSNSNSNKNDSTNSNSKPTENKEVEKPIWEKLGMTEDQYYNQPMMKWQRVDFSINKYKTEAKTMEACISYGDSYEPYKNGEVLYMCDKVFSASGKFLGVMFDTEKLVS